MSFVVIEEKRTNSYNGIMAVNTKYERTREEVLAWLQQARNRKESFQRETNEWWQARQKGLKEAAESGYYNIEMV